MSIASRPRLLGTAPLAVLLVLAAICDTVEPMLSPIPDSSTRADVTAIAAHQGQFVLSVLVGVAGTLMFLPAFLALLSRTVGSAPVSSRIAAVCVVLSFPCFMGVRVGQAIELQGVRDGLPTRSTAGLLDHVDSNPIGAPIVLLFLLGTVLGMIALSVALWRSGLPRPAAVLAALFPIVDVASESHLPNWMPHLLLLAAMIWVAATLLRGDRPDRVSEAVPVAA